MTVVAVGLDPPEETAPWAEGNAYPFEVWSDDGGVLVATYGELGGDGLPLRHAALLDESGGYLLHYQGAISFGASPHSVLADCEALFR